MRTDLETNAINGITSIVIGFKRKINIVGIADSVGLGQYIPSKLRQHREDDFNFDGDVSEFLTAVLKNEDVSSQASLLEELYNIKRYYFCKKFKRGICDIPKTTYWSAKECTRCKNFASDGNREKLVDHYMTLGFSVTEDGIVVPSDAGGIDIEKEVVRIQRELSPDFIEDLLPEDIRKRGKEMSEVYTYLYCVENSLRLFIDKVCSEKFGTGYINKLHLSKEMRAKIKNRKVDQEKNKWLSVRGDIDLFYLDLEDLGSLIQNNWSMFQEYFPEQNWIIPKIKEISDVRHLVAHNSYVGKEERRLLQTYYGLILKQLQKTLKPPDKEIEFDF